MTTNSAIGQHFVEKVCVYFISIALVLQPKIRPSVIKVSLMLIMDLESIVELTSQEKKQCMIKNDKNIDLSYLGFEYSETCFC